MEFRIVEFEVNGPISAAPTKRSSSPAKMGLRCQIIVASSPTSHYSQSQADQRHIGDAAHVWNDDDETSSQLDVVSASCRATRFLPQNSA